MLNMRWVDCDVVKSVIRWVDGDFSRRCASVLRYGLAT